MRDVDSSLETPFDLLRDQDAESIVGQDLVSKAQQANRTHSLWMLPSESRLNTASGAPRGSRT